MNIVMTASDRFVEVQGTAEANAFFPRRTCNLLDIARRGHQGGIDADLLARRALVSRKPEPSPVEAVNPALFDRVVLASRPMSTRRSEIRPRFCTSFWAMMSIDPQSAESDDVPADVEEDRYDPCPGQRPPESGSGAGRRRVFPAIADDTGLEVKALDRSAGCLFTARFTPVLAHPMPYNVNKLLGDLEGSTRTGQRPSARLR